MTEKQRKSYIALIDKAQKNYPDTYLHRCPRCGRALRSNLLHNALSRRENVHVCDACGTEEAIRDMKNFPLPLADWFVFRNLHVHGEFPERPTLFAMEPEISDDCIEVTFECWFDVAGKLGVDLAAHGDDSWINLYASYNVKTEELRMFYTVDDNARNESFYYIPTEAERISVLANMEKCCKDEGFNTMAEMVAHYAEES